MYVPPYLLFRWTLPLHFVTYLSNLSNRSKQKKGPFLCCWLSCLAQIPDRSITLVIHFWKIPIQSFSKKVANPFFHIPKVHLHSIMTATCIWEQIFPTTVSRCSDQTVWSMEHHNSVSSCQGGTGTKIEQKRATKAASTKLHKKVCLPFAVVQSKMKFEG